MNISRGLRRVFALALIFAAAGASGADLNKVLRVAINAPENGFDPQASSDLYSNYVNREIFWAKFSTSSESPQRWPSVRAALRPTFSLRIVVESGPEHDAKPGWRAEAAVFPLQ